ncbi:MAG TPA: hypothetical protein DEH78_29410, partial [Solibacterales bacterium]|nr:hypothetical protein [Bryobacterales bacterium]
MAWSTSRADYILAAEDRGLEPEYFVGLDLGQAQDHTALVVVERRVLRRTVTDGVVVTAVRMEYEYAVRAAARLALGMSYVDVAKKVTGAVRKLSREGRCTLVVDASGVGAAVLDSLRGEVREARVLGVVLTGGRWTTRGAGRWNVPRREVLGLVQVMLEKGELRLGARMAGREELE